MDLGHGTKDLDWRNLQWLVDPLSEISWFGWMQPMVVEPQAGSSLSDIVPKSRHDLVRWWF